MHLSVVIGGSEPCNEEVSSVPRNTVFRMDMDTKKWTQISDMNVYRHSHCACALKGQIYVIGGRGKYDSVLLSVESYDPKTDGWYFVPSLPEPMFAASAVTLGSRMIVTGGIGTNRNNPSALHVLNTVYSYNTISNGWTKLHPLRFPRCFSNLVNVNGKLYLCGGATRTYEAKNSLLCSVSAIDRYDAVDGEWHHVTDLVIPRHDSGAAIAGKKNHY
ncbi:beta-scruin-like [Mercenaria mercenaria]|uniref:beta-scruin-like n=1 Tax=Mercenaria mercenaria TaxID=6596 RepID=UPI00234FA986|nr:beta-scruin-like [Mercenaria mercenaria]